MSPPRRGPTLATSVASALPRNLHEDIAVNVLTEPGGATATAVDGVNVDLHPGHPEEGEPAPPTDVQPADGAFTMVDAAQVRQHLRRGMAKEDFRQVQGRTYCQIRMLLANISRIAIKHVPVLPTFQAFVRSADNSKSLNVLFDSGSTDTYVSSAVAKELALNVVNTVCLRRSTVDGVNNVVCDEVVLALSSNTEQFTMEFSALVVPSIVELPAFNVRIPGNLQMYKFGDLYPKGKGSVDFLLGMDQGVRILTGGLVRAEGLALLSSHFGHLVMGEVEPHRSGKYLTTVTNPPKVQRKVRNVGALAATVTAAEAGKDLLDESFVSKGEASSQDSKLSSMLERFWDLEHIGISAIPRADESRLTTAEEAAVSLLQKRTLFENRRYILPLLWKDEDRPTNNYRMAYMRLLSEEKRLLRKPELMAAYKDELKKLVDQGSCSMIGRRAKDDQLCFFVPHRPVVKPGAKSSKVRPVFDASCKDRTGISLNERLYNGPKRQRELPGILLRFRFGKVAMAADIRKMFHQFLTCEEDRPFQRFLWRDCDQKRDPDIYEFNSVVFGYADAPFKTIETIDTHVEKYRTEFPDTVSGIKRDIFVDDILKAFKNVKSASTFITEAQKILSDGSLHLYKFVSNSSSLLQILAPEERGSSDLLLLSESQVLDDEPESTSALGVQYAPTEDCFLFRGFEVLMDGKPPTKRQIVSKMSRLWDPMGFLGPFLVTAKLVVRDCWLQEVDWDVVPPAPVVERWNKWLEQIPDLSNVKIPRNIDTCEVAKERRLHCLTDASQQAMCACVYIRSVWPNGSIEVRLLIAKTRVAPVKAQTLPRLELIGCLMGARLNKYVCDELDLNLKDTQFWCDSKTALQWIAKAAATWKCFVSSRVGTIHELSEQSQWRHIPGVENSSDLGSRGFPAKDLYETRFWFEDLSF